MANLNIKGQFCRVPLKNISVTLASWISMKLIMKVIDMNVTLDINVRGVDGL